MLFYITTHTVGRPPPQPSALTDRPTEQSLLLEEVLWFGLPVPLLGGQFVDKERLKKGIHSVARERERG